MKDFKLTAGGLQDWIAAVKLARTAGVQLFERVTETACIAKTPFGGYVVKGILFFCKITGRSRQAAPQGKLAVAYAHGVLEYGRKPAGTEGAGFCRFCKGRQFADSIM